MTGRALYSMYQMAQAQFGESQRDWVYLHGWEQTVWDELAKKVEAWYD